MSREYAPLFISKFVGVHAQTDSHAVIAKDLGDDGWFLWESNVSSADRAKEIADAMNAGGS